MELWKSHAKRPNIPTGLYSLGRQVVKKVLYNERFLRVPQSVQLSCTGKAI